MTIRMRDVSEKKATKRTATARAILLARPETIEAIKRGKIWKGDVFSGATVAGISAAKKTSELLPLCHPVQIDHVSVNIQAGWKKIVILAQVRGRDRTGMEMEALTAAALAALTIYDMCKAVDPEMKISEVALLEKTGGKSGTWRRKE